MEHWLGPPVGSVWHLLDRPVQAESDPFVVGEGLIQAVPKEGRAMREAGFTEQRSPPSLGSGRITDQSHSGPHGLVARTQMNHHFFLFTLSFLINRNSTNVYRTKISMSTGPQPKSTTTAYRWQYHSFPFITCDVRRTRHSHFRRKLKTNIFGLLIKTTLLESAIN